MVFHQSQGHMIASSSPFSLHFVSTVSPSHNIYDASTFLQLSWSSLLGNVTMHQRGYWLEPGAKAGYLSSIPRYPPLTQYLKDQSWSKLNLMAPARIQVTPAKDDKILNDDSKTSKTLSRHEHIHHCLPSQHNPWRVCTWEGSSRSFIVFSL